MELEELTKTLAPWLKLESWDSESDADQARFNNALKQAFEKFGTGLTFEDFNEAILLGIQQFHPKLEIDEDLSEFVEDFAQVAEEIGIYLRDTK